MTDETTRARRKTRTGVVTSDKMRQTRRVEIPRLVRHAKYGKYLHRRTVCYAHDESEQSHVGDKVEIEESRPLSKLKRWTLLRVVEKSQAVDAHAALHGQAQS